MQRRHYAASGMASPLPSHTAAGAGRALSLSQVLDLPVRGVTQSRLRVHVREGRSLPSVTSRCYCRIRFNGQEVKTSVRRGSKPKWDEVFHFEVPAPTTAPDREVLEVSVWDKVKWLADNELGRLYIKLADVRKLKNAHLEAWFAALRPGKDPRLTVTKEAGELLVSLQFGFTDEEQVMYIRAMHASLLARLKERISALKDGTYGERFEGSADSEDELEFPLTGSTTWATTTAHDTTGYSGLDSSDDATDLEDGPEDGMHHATNQEGRRVKGALRASIDWPRPPTSAFGVSAMQPLPRTSGGPIVRHCHASPSPVITPTSDEVHTMPATDTMLGSKASGGTKIPSHRASAESLSSSARGALQPVPEQTHDEARAPKETADAAASGASSSSSFQALPLPEPLPTVSRGDLGKAEALPFPESGVDKDVPAPQGPDHPGYRRFGDSASAHSLCSDGFLPSPTDSIGSVQATKGAISASGDALPLWNHEMVQLLQFNERFQVAVETLKLGEDIGNTMAQANQDLINVAQDFLFAAKTYGKIVISERYLPDHLKTIHSLPHVGGKIGGVKFVHQSIFYKLAVPDTKVIKTVEAAMKVAGHELKGCSCYYNANIFGLAVPLMALLDYKGFRLIALTVLPVNAKSLVVGTPDGGTTIRSDDAELNRKLRRAGKMLNIQSHFVGRKLMYSATDLEGHVGSDGRFYLLDFSRVMPPEFPKNGSAPGSIFYRLLRPEFVATYGRPLCSDAFSGFRSPQSHAYEEEVAKATEMLLASIPSFAIKLGDMIEAEIKAWPAFVSFHHKLPRIIHAKGINMRYLGLLYKYAKTDNTHTVLLIEMCSRVIKHELRARMRAKMEQLTFPLEQPYIQLVVDFLNACFTTPQIWSDVIEPRLCRTFDLSMDALARKPVKQPSSSGKTDDSNARKTLHALDSLGQRSMDLKHVAAGSDLTATINLPMPTTPSSSSPTTDTGSRTESAVASSLKRATSTEQATGARANAIAASPRSSSAAVPAPLPSKSATGDDIPTLAHTVTSDDGIAGSDPSTARSRSKTSHGVRKSHRRTKSTEGKPLSSFRSRSHTKLRDLVSSVASASSGQQSPTSAYREWSAYHEIASWPGGFALLMLRLQRCMGLNFSHRIMEQLQRAAVDRVNGNIFDQRKCFDVSDLDSLGERVKHMNVIAQAQATAFKDKAVQAVSPVNALHFYRMAVERFEEALDGNPTSKVTLRAFAQVLLEMELSGPSAQSSTLSLSDPNIAAVNGTFELALRYDPADSITLGQYARFLSKCGEHAQAQIYFLKAIDEDLQRPWNVQRYSRLLNDLGREVDSSEFYNTWAEYKNLLLLNKGTQS